MRHMRKVWFIRLAALLAMLLGVSLALRPGTLPSWSADPAMVMGTTCRLITVGSCSKGRAGLQAAEAELRQAEIFFSAQLAQSPIGIFNAGPAGTSLAIPAPQSEVFDQAWAIWKASDGAFDVTCRPLLELWRDAGRSGILPTDAAIAQTRALCGFQAVAWRDQKLIKLQAGGRIDLGGIVKGWAVARALTAMRAAGAQGGMVQVGGEIAVFGTAPDGQSWPVSLRSPFKDEVFGTVRLTAGALSSSGNYARYTEIAGRRYSHIVDPRSGRPVDDTPSVTVHGPDGTAVDAWATALSVLGPPGLARLPPACQALLIYSPPGGGPPVIHQTPGFATLLAGPTDLRSGPR